MTTYKPDGLFAFGNALTVELPPNDARPDTANDATQKAPLGTLYRYKGNLFRYVQQSAGSGSVATAQYGVALWLAAGLDPSNGIFTVTADHTQELAGINSMAGVFGGIVTSGNYTWIQVGGYATVTCAAGFVTGDVAIGGATDLTLARVAADGSVTSVPFAIATGTRSGGGTDTFLLEASRLACL